MDSEPRGATAARTTAAFSAAPSPLNQVSIDLPLSVGHEDAVESVRRSLQSMAPFVAEGTLAREEAIHRAVLDQIILATPMRALDAARAALEQRAIAAIFSGTEWLSADQVGRLRDAAARNPHATVNRWRSEGKVFALTKGGNLFYARYQFDEALDPQPVVADVIQAFAGFSPYRVAAWFESTNGALGGRRPRDCLATRPDAVRQAAQQHLLGPVHG